MTLNPLTPRDYQLEIIQAAQDRLAQEPSVLVTAPTGAGKTVIAAEIMARAARKGRRSALLVHREELLEQSAQKIEAQTGERPGIVWKSARGWEAPIVVMAQNTVAGNPIPAGMSNIPLLIVDEAHHTVAPTWLDTIARISPRYLIGMSATPFRQDREPLHPQPFASVIRPVTPKDLIDRGVLCPADVRAPLIQDRSGRIQKIGQASNLPEIYLEAVRHAIANGRSKILLYVSQTAEQPPAKVMLQAVKRLQQAGITAGSIHQQLSSKQRRQRIAEFTEAPGASVLANYITLTEGTDLPLVDCVIVGRATQSESTLIQMIGRGLRTHPHKKDCLVLDYSGRPDTATIIHYWRLDEPKEPGAHTPKQPAKAERARLELLTTRFAETMGDMGNAKIDFPWFRPFARRPLVALPLWRGEGEAGRFVTAEAQPGGTWRITTITLETAGPAPLTRRQQSALTEEDAAKTVRAIIGDQAGLVRRNAPWRARNPSARMVEEWAKLHPNRNATPLTLAGDMADAIAQERFRRRVAPDAL